MYPTYPVSGDQEASVELALKNEHTVCNKFTAQNLDRVQDGWYILYCVRKRLATRWFYQDHENVWTDAVQWPAKARLFVGDDCDVRVDQAHLVSHVLKLEPDIMRTREEGFSFSYVHRSMSSDFFCCCVC